jgi:F0F1-type ATP synthase membrane subunit b/b'
MSDSTYEAIAVWSQVIASILFIVVLVYLWIRFIAPAVLTAQAQRNAELADAEQRRDAARAEAEAAQRELASAATDAAAIAARAQADATRIHERLVADARAEGERLVKNAGGELERSRFAARTEFRDELIAKALEIARNASSSLDPATERKLVDETVETADRGAHG